MKSKPQRKNSKKASTNSLIIPQKDKDKIEYIAKYEDITNALDKKKADKESRQN